MNRLLTTLTLLASLVAAPAAAKAGRPETPGCVLLEHRDSIVLHLRSRPHPAAAATGAKQIRDAHGTFPNVVESSNFVAKWGPDATYSQAQIDRMLEGFEVGWGALIDSMGFPPPTGTETYKLNVYIGNSGGNAPEIPDYAGGYADVDPEGYPMMVIHPTLMTYYETPGYEPYADETMIHEFFHTVQFGTGAYSLGNEDTYWYWEATAEWAAAQAQPDSPALWGLVGGYALYPHIALHFYDYPDTGSLIELHHYGAGIFAQYVSEHAADWQVIRDSWVDADADGDPLLRIQSLLEERGQDLTDVFADFAAHTAVWDYQRGPLMEQMVDYYAESYPGEDHRYAAIIPNKGTNGLVDAALDLAPGSYGYNVLRMSGVAGTGTLEVEVAPESADVPMAATLVRAATTGVEYLRLQETEDGTLRTDVETSTTGDTLYLVVSAHPDPHTVITTYPYAYRADLIAADPGDDDPAGCACTVTPAKSAAVTWPVWLLVSVGLLVLRRRGRDQID